MPNERHLTLEARLRKNAARLTLSDTPHLDMRIMAKAALGLEDAALLLSSDRLLSADEIARLDAMVARRMAGESVAHIVGEKEFYGLVFKLAPGVLSPRPDTETLIDAAGRRLHPAASLRILDLGVGSGAILCSLLHAFPNATGVGVDCNFAAALCARTNALRLGFGARTRVLCGRWMEALSGEFDLIVSNPPYIPMGAARELPPEIRLFEDPRALFAGVDGLAAYRAILPAARALMSQHSLMLLEFGISQAEALSGLAGEWFPDHAIAVEPDIAGRPRVLVLEPTI